MSKKISIFSLLFVLVLGTLNHFMYDWFPLTIVGLFTPVNESIFEHLKLTFYPFLLTCIIRYFFLKDKDYFLKVALACVTGIVVVPIIYYLINIFITPPAIVNIIIFILACMLQEYVFYNLMNIIFTDSPIGSAEGFIVIITISLAFTVFTFIPPKLDLFLDPVTKTYGIYKNT